MPPEVQDRHPGLRERSRQVLDDVRRLAAAEFGYDSSKTRNAMDDVFKKSSACHAYPWQLDVAEALLLKVDCLVIAGTGSGKTTPFMLPLLLPENKAKIVLIVSLLTNQAARFNRVGVSAVAVNHDTMDTELLKRLNSNTFQAIFAGPEMIMENKGFSVWIRSKSTLERFLFVAVDEAHLIRLWGGDFRPHYHLLARLRSLLPTCVPVFPTSATVTPVAEREICDILEMDFHKAYYLNLGNDCPNITESVSVIKSSDDYEVLLQFLPDSKTPAGHWPKTQIFVNTVLEAQVICAFLISKYPEALRSKFDFIHSLRTPTARRRRLRRFHRGAIKVLISTEIGSMGQDIADIVQVVKFGAPESLEQLRQEFGRAGRDPDILTRAVFLVEKSCFQV
ncbi:P-loop containing nucleoside triphosphate hydrolase protein [Mycena amicta]|nr:P-loop containing nucleoside triphosphate hydrolase protein [Mycena amicta]